MKALLLVRHGEAEHHVREITGGWTNTYLTDIGRNQAQLLARRLAVDMDSWLIHLATSRLDRAVETARIIGGELGLEVAIYPELVDLNNGVAAGKTHSEARLLACPPSEPILEWRPYPQAESWREFFERTAGFMERLDRTQHGFVLAVTHAANIHAIVAWWLGLPVESRTHFEIAPASLTVLNYNRWKERTLERLNDCAHLHAAGMQHLIRP